MPSPKYGILKGKTNTGLESELACVFVAPMSINSNQPAYAADTINLRRKTMQTNLQRWELETGVFGGELPVDLLVHSVINGYSTTFFVRMPQLFRNTRIADDINYYANVSYAQGVKDNIYIDGGRNTQLPKGEFIRFRGHSKVYLITSSSLDENGLSNISIHPALVGDVDAAESLFYGAGVTMHAKYDTDTRLGISFRDGILSDISTAKIVEVL